MECRHKHRHALCRRLCRQLRIPMPPRHPAGALARLTQGNTDRLCRQQSQRQRVCTRHQCRWQHTLLCRQRSTRQHRRRGCLYLPPQRQQMESRRHRDGPQPHLWQRSPRLRHHRRHLPAPLPKRPALPSRPHCQRVENLPSARHHQQQHLASRRHHRRQWPPHAMGRHRPHRPRSRLICQHLCLAPRQQWPLERTLRAGTCHQHPFRRALPLSPPRHAHPLLLLREPRLPGANGPLHVHTTQRQQLDPLVSTRKHRERIQHHR